MSRARPTIYDVAKEAEVSKSLVSLVLRNSPSVSARSTKAVNDAINKLGYQPNRAASDLAAKHRNLIAVLIDDYSNPWFIDMLQALSEVLTPQGYRLSVIDSLTAGSDTDPITHALTMRPDGIIIAQDIAEKSLPDNMPPFVVAGTRFTPVDTASTSSKRAVSNDDFLGAKIATEHLISLGHTDIAHINVHSGAGQKRLASYVSTMRDNGLQPILNETPGPATERLGYDTAMELLEENPGITAIFASNDITAIGVLGAARTRGLHVPRELSVVGYDNTPLAQSRLIDLTTIDDNSIGVGRNAALLLLNKLDAKNAFADVDHTLVPQLIIRGTSAKPRSD